MTTAGSTHLFSVLLAHRFTEPSGRSHGAGVDAEAQRDGVPGPHGHLLGTGVQPPAPDASPHPQAAQRKHSGEVSTGTGRAS